MSRLHSFWFKTWLCVNEKNFNIFGITDCREVALRYIRKQIQKGLQSRRRLTTSDYHSIITQVTFTERLNCEWLYELSDVFNVSIDIIKPKQSVKEEYHYRLFGNDNHVLPAWYWLIALLRLGKKDGSIFDILVSSKGTDWLKSVDRHRAINAWRSQLNGIGPTSKQMLVYNCGPFDWLVRYNKGLINCEQE